MTWSSSLILTWLLNGTVNQPLRVEAWGHHPKSARHCSCSPDRFANPLIQTSIHIRFCFCDPIKMMYGASSWFISDIIGWLLKIMKNLYQTIIQDIPSLAEEVSVAGLFQAQLIMIKSNKWGSIFMICTPGAYTSASMRSMHTQKGKGAYVGSFLTWGASWIASPCRMNVPSHHKRF